MYQCYGTLHHLSFPTPGADPADKTVGTAWPSAPHPEDASSRLLQATSIRLPIAQDGKLGGGPETVGDRLRIDARLDLQAQLDRRQHPPELVQGNRRGGPRVPEVLVPACWPSVPGCLE